MDRRHTVSVVMTTRNSAQTIDRCLASLLPYQERGLITDVVLVDSHSIDGTLEVVRRYPVQVLQEEKAESYRNSVIRQYRSTYSALDQGWRHAKGDLVMFLDSDAWLGEGMFPRATEFFADGRLGVLGCWQKGVGANGFSRTMAQFWEFHGQRIMALQNGSWALPRQAYLWAAWFGSDHPPIGGPCYMVRRECLEMFNGHDAYGDVGIAARARERGWHTWWWVGAPVYHRQRESISALWRERWQWGQTAAFRPHKASHYLSLPVSLIGSFMLGGLMAARYRNLLHLAVYPSMVTAQLAGGIVTRLARLLGRR